MPMKAVNLTILLPIVGHLHPQQPVPVIDNNHYDTQNIENGIATNMVSRRFGGNACPPASKAIKLKRAATICFWITLVIGFANPIFLCFAAFCGDVYLW